MSGPAHRTAWVSVNHERHALPPDTDLAALLQRLGVPAASVATAVNGRFVPREARGDHRLADGDAVTCFQPIVGG